MCRERVKALAAHLQVFWDDASIELDKAVVAQQLVDDWLKHAGFVPEAPELIGMAEQGQHAVADQGARRLVAGHQEPLPAIARGALKTDTRPQATHTRLYRFNPTKHHHVRDQRLPHVAARLSQPRQRNRRPDRRMNKRAIRRLARLARRYENCRTIPLLKDFETALWCAGEVACYSARRFDADRRANRLKSLDPEGQIPAPNNTPGSTKAGSARSRTPNSASPRSVGTMFCP